MLGSRKKDKRAVGELGSRLREARENQGLSLEQVEEVTRIRRVFLEALEEERFDELPGDVYTKGFIRNYARFLGLDPEELLAEYRSLTGEKPTIIPQVLDEPLMRRSRPPLWASLFLSFMVVLALGLIGWYAYNRYYLGVSPSLQGLWPRRANSPTATSTPSPTREIKQVVQPKATQKQAEPTATSTPMQPTATATPTSLPSPTPRRRPSPTPDLTREAQQPEIQVAAHFVDKTYLKVTLDGEMVFEGILNPGEDQTWTAKKSIILRVGNAAGVRLKVNGVEVPPLGEKGQVVDLEYTPENLPQE